MSNSIKILNYITLLLKNHNVVFHGAPGTGKTYLAKEIAKELIFSKEEKQLLKRKQNELTDAEKEKIQQLESRFNERCGFVQFHQSYDYTDFVEGLRPINQGQGKIGFKLKAGVFKAFCKKALEYGPFEENDELAEVPIVALREEQPIAPALYTDEQIKQGIERLKAELRERVDRTMTIPGIRRTDVTIKLVDDKIKAQATAGRNYQDRDYNTSPKKIELYIRTRQYSEGHDTYEPAIGQYIIDHYMPAQPDQAVANNPVEEPIAIENFIPKNAFVFIIDEINRGEMSKIFGELFFSIDPGYRGEKGKIRTQYQNLVAADDVFADGFYIPKNVYIIGTMNDIDRSVESMDFAMRRRFAFKEITAADSVDMLDELGVSALIENAKKKMSALNLAIENTDGLSSAYHIGPAYFLKLKKYGDDFDTLWKCHIEGVVREYLRGMDDAEQKRKILESAYKK